MLCECGCGLRTNIAAYTSARWGWVKGQPRRFVAGHNSKGKPTKEYRRVQVGPRLDRVHRVRAERALGKTLPRGAQVHHVDGTQSDTSALVICQDQAYHFLLHVRTRIVRAGGNPNTDKICSACKAVKPRTEFRGNRTRYDGLVDECRACRRTRMGRKAA